MRGPLHSHKLLSQNMYKERIEEVFYNRHGQEIGPHISKPKFSAFHLQEVHVHPLK